MLSNLSKTLLFTQGLVLGLVLTMSFLFILAYNSLSYSQENSIELMLNSYLWLKVNLGFSSILFTLILIIYAYIWQRMRKSLVTPGVDLWKQILHDEHLLEMLTGLAFGVGVIWTAIGMREALLAAFGANEINNLANKGALAMLEKLINGGILAALTSTVVGGVMGYILRIFKTLTLECKLNDYQENKQLIEQQNQNRVFSEQ